MLAVYAGVLRKRCTSANRYRVALNNQKGKMMNSKSPIIAAGMLILITALSACQKKDDMSGKGPAEKAGAQIDSAAAKAGEELNKAGEKAEQAMQSAAEKTGQMMQEAGKQMEEKAHEKAQDAKK